MQVAAFLNKQIKNHVYKIRHEREAEKITPETIRKVNLRDDFHCTVKGTKAPTNEIPCQS